MTDAAFEALNTPAMYDQIVAEWQAGNDTMKIAGKIRALLDGQGCCPLPSENEIQAHAHNVLALHRDTVRVARQQEARRT